MKSSVLKPWPGARAARRGRCRGRAALHAAPWRGRVRCGPLQFLARAGTGVGPGRTRRPGRSGRAAPRCDCQTGVASGCRPQRSNWWRMVWSAPGMQRGVSTSSSRTSHWPWAARASSQLARAATKEPACSGPVGEGAAPYVATGFGCAHAFTQGHFTASASSRPEMKASSRRCPRHQSPHSAQPQAGVPHVACPRAWLVWA